MTINLRSVDLNSLVIFEALVEERSVVRAASRIGLTPSAVSHALRRLRQSFGDELLVRRGGDFEPTPHATKLMVELGPALARIAGALDLPRSFDPARAHRNFHIGVPDYTGDFLLPRLCRHLGIHAPDVSLSVLPLDDRRSADIVAYDGVEIHLSLHGQADVVRPVQMQRLIEDTFMILMSRQNPAAGRALTLDNYLDLRHIKVTGLGNALDDRLAQLGMARRIMVKIPSWQSVLSIVEASDLVALIPRHWTTWTSIQDRFWCTPLPLDDFFLSVDALWHPRNEHDAGHRWFRTLIQELFRALRTDGLAGPRDALLQ